MNRFLVLPLTLIACHESAHDGISKADAVEVLTKFRYTNVVLGPIPNGWSGIATPIDGGYTIQVTVDDRGLITFRP